MKQRKTASTIFAAGEKTVHIDIDYWKQ